MGLFGLLKQKKSNEKTETERLLEFLDVVDDTLTLAYIQKDITDVARYLHPELADYIVEEISSNYDWAQMYGLEKYRIRTWSTPSEISNGYIVHKTLRHKDVKIKGMISIPVGDNMDEDWYVSKTDNGFIVTDIRQGEVE